MLAGGKGRECVARREGGDDEREGVVALWIRGFKG